MASHVRFGGLTCNETEDWGGGDIVTLKWMDSDNILGPMRFNKGHTNSAGPELWRMFADWQVQLWEDDAPDPDDFLGEHLVTLGAAGGGVQRAEFRLDGASYDLQYEVMDIEGADTAEAGESQAPRRV